MHSKDIEEVLWVDLPKPAATPENRVADALQRALNNTRPDYAGTPWDDVSEKTLKRGYLISGSD